MGRVGPEFQVVRGVLIQAHCPGCETRGSLQTPVFRGRPTRPAISKWSLLFKPFGRSPKKIWVFRLSYTVFPTAEPIEISTWRAERVGPVAVQETETETETLASLSSSSKGRLRAERNFGWISAFCLNQRVSIGLTPPHSTAQVTVGTPAVPSETAAQAQTFVPSRLRPWRWGLRGPRNTIRWAEASRRRPSKRPVRQPDALSIAYGRRAPPASEPPAMAGLVLLQRHGEKNAGK